MMPGKSPCCICGKTSTHIVGTGGAFAYTTCTRHYELLRRAFDSEDEKALSFPVCFPAGTWAETAEVWTASGFVLGNPSAISGWERYVQGLSGGA